MAALAALPTPASAGTVEVVVLNVRNAQGDVRVAVCSEAAFLKPTCEHVGHAPAQPGQTVIRIEGVPPGIWAAQAFHDENRNGIIDTNILGIPIEGLGFSNDARFLFGPPGFDAAAFRLGPQGGRIRFSLRYF